MKNKLRISFVALALVLTPILFVGCTSVIKVAPYPTAEPWGNDVKRLGVVTADSGPWPLSLHSPPPDYTFYAALRTNASSQFSVPESEVVLGEVTVKIGAELDGTIRDWKASAEAGQKKEPQVQAKSPADSLIELKKLLDAGAITPADYETRKKLLLDKL